MSIGLSTTDSKSKNVKPKVATPAVEGQGEVEVEAPKENNRGGLEKGKGREHNRPKKDGREGKDGKREFDRRSGTGR